MDIVDILSLQFIVCTESDVLLRNSYTKSHMDNGYCRHLIYDSSYVQNLMCYQNYLVLNQYVVCINFSKIFEYSSSKNLNS